MEFGPDGTYLSKFGSFGTGNGQFNTPLGIATDFIGNIWVTDWANHNLQEFSATGTYLATFGSYGIGSGQYLSPMGIAVIPAPLPPPPVGTVLWTNSGDGSGFASIIPAVPASTGVADIFGLQNDGTVAAITSAGNTAWTATLPTFPTVLADFQGGLVVANFAANGVGGSITKLDGITGQPYPAYNFASGQLFGPPVVHTDGTIFAIQSNPDRSSSVVGIDPTTGTQKFSVPMNPTWASSNCPPGGNFAGVDMYGSAFKLMIAGDGNAYVAYFYAECGTYPGGSQLLLTALHLKLLQITSAGSSNTLTIQDYSGAQFMSEAEIATAEANMITNGDTGVLCIWSISYSSGESGSPPDYGVAITTGTSVSVTLGAGPTVPGQTDLVTPVLQAQDGSFVGSVPVPGPAPTYSQTNMVAFDATGNVRWVVPNETPQIATADGGFIGQSGTTYNQNGQATGQIANLPTYSWLGNAYQIGFALYQVQANPLLYAVGFWEFEQANQSRSKTAPLPTDSTADNKVKNILTKAFWQKFSNSNCKAVLGNSAGMPLIVAGYSLAAVVNEQNLVHFYDVSDGGVGSLQLDEITSPTFGGNVTLTNELGSSTAATPVLGKGPVILAGSVLSGSRPEFTLVHEILFHAYAGQYDNYIYGNAYFTSNGLWRPSGSNATVTITNWLSTDCTCTPSNPSAPQSCHANSAKW